VRSQTKNVKSRDEIDALAHLLATGMRLVKSDPAIPAPAVLFHDESRRLCCRPRRRFSVRCRCPCSKPG
jgi:hypothetical protein